MKKKLFRLALAVAIALVPVFGLSTTRAAAATASEEAEAIENQDAGYFKYIEQQQLTPDDEKTERSAVYFDESGTSLATKWNSTTFYHDSTKVNGRNIYVGIDVSYHNGTIDWEAVKADGIQFAFLRIGYRGYGAAGNMLPDRKYEEYIADAKAAGLKVGVYFYSQATSVEEAEEEAEYVLELLDGEVLDLPVVFDYEYYTSSSLSDGYGRLKPSLSKQVKTDACNKFCEVIESNGYQGCVYASKSFLTSDMYYSQLSSDYEVWLAHYTTGPSSYEGTYDYWQCTSSASVDGISGNVDLDFAYGELSSVVSFPSDVVIIPASGSSTDTSTGTETTTGGSVSDVTSGSSSDSTTVGTIDLGTDVKEYTLEKRSDGVWRVYCNGIVDTTYVGLLKNEYGWWYCKNGVVDRTFTSIAKNEYGWWYVRKGQVDFSASTVVKRTSDNTWWFVKGGKVQTSLTSVVYKTENQTWWYVKNGKVQFDETSVVHKVENDTWWYCENGQVKFDTTAFVKRTETGTWWYVKNSKVQTSLTTVMKKPGGTSWWRITNGKVDFKYNGLAQNAYGWWYIKNGKVDFTYTGWVTVQSGKYYVVKGKAQR